MSPDTGPLTSVGGSTGDFPARSPQRLKVSFEFSPPKTEAAEQTLWQTVTRDRKSTRLNSSHSQQSRMPSSA